MKCMSCHRRLSGKEAQLWEKRLVCCIRCKELGDKAAAEVRARCRAAEQAALFDVEQMLLDGVLVRGIAPSLPGLGVRDE